MGKLILEDTREYIFPLFSVETRDNGVFLESRVFLGTAFFVSTCGDAITANHVLPKPNELTPARRLVAIVQRGNEQQVCWITHAASLDGCDLALIHINLEQTKCLSLTDVDVDAGSDVQIIGIPNHEVWCSGKEMRVLKGHVTLASKYLELSVSVPSGMSGSPVFLGTKVVAYATGVVASEALEEYSEEVELLANGKEQIRITQVKRMMHYGLAYPFSKLRGQTSPIFEGHTLFSFVTARNERGRGRAQ